MLFNLITSILGIHLGAADYIIVSRRVSASLTSGTVTFKILIINMRSWCNNFNHKFDNLAQIIFSFFT